MFQQLKHRSRYSLSHTYHGSSNRDITDNEAIEKEVASTSRRVEFRKFSPPSVQLQNTTSSESFYEQISNHDEEIEEEINLQPNDQSRGHMYLKIESGVSAQSNPELYSKVSSPDESEGIYRMSQKKLQSDFPHQ